jgi:uncharacterized protein
MQEIENPFGITVFGSATVRVEPDVAVLSFSVSEVRPTPKEAFEAIRESAQKLQAFLTQANIRNSGSSRISLDVRYEYKDSKHEFMGYETQIGYRILLYDLDQVENILIGIMDAGVNRVGAVDFQTTRLKQIRAEARQQAIAAAREKAEIYCAAAGVQLGDVIHIEDVNPKGFEHLGTAARGQASQDIVEDENAFKAFNPDSIIVAGAVRVAYKFQGHQFAAGFLKGDLQ